MNTPRTNKKNRTTHRNNNLNVNVYSILTPFILASTNENISQNHLQLLASRALNQIFKEKTNNQKYKIRELISSKFPNLKSSINQHYVTDPGFHTFEQLTPYILKFQNEDLVKHLKNIKSSNSKNNIKKAMNRILTMKKTNVTNNDVAFLIKYLFSMYTDTRFAEAGRVNNLVNEKTLMNDIKKYKIKTIEQLLQYYASKEFIKSVNSLINGEMYQLIPYLYNTMKPRLTQQYIKLIKEHITLKLNSQKNITVNNSFLPVYNKLYIPKPWPMQSSIITKKVNSYKKTQKK